MFVHERRDSFICKDFVHGIEFEVRIEYILKT